MSPRTYNQVARAEATERTRRAILDAAERLFLEQGSYELPLDEVADEAGVTTRTVLRHFGTREGLIEAGLADTDSAVTRERSAEPGDVEAALRRLFGHYERVGDQVMRMLAAADRFPLVRRAVDGGQAEHRRWVAEVFEPDLDGVGPSERKRRLAMLATVTDVYAWHLLRRRHGLSRRDTEDAIHDLVGKLRGAT